MAREKSADISPAAPGVLAGGFRRRSAGGAVGYSIARNCTSLYAGFEASSANLDSYDFDTGQLLPMKTTTDAFFRGPNSETVLPDRSGSEKFGTGWPTFAFQSESSRARFVPWRVSSLAPRTN